MELSFQKFNTNVIFVSVNMRPHMLLTINLFLISTPVTSSD